MPRDADGAADWSATVERTMGELHTGGLPMAETSMRLRQAVAGVWRRRATWIAALTMVALAAHVTIRFGFGAEAAARLPLFAALVLGGIPLVGELALRLVRRQFGSDLLAGISIVTAVILDQYVAGTLVVLMLAGGGALESYALRQASSVLQALARRMPSVAHRRRGNETVAVPLSEVTMGDLLVILPHEVCPADGIVREGRGAMDESYLTGEPFRMTKIPGSAVISGAVNGDGALVIEATRRPEDSRYAKIMQVMRESEETRPHLRRLGDRLGAWYTPVAVGLALAAWAWSGEAIRFLAVLVVATPCPLLIAIPVAIVGSISLCARRGIVVKSPIALERITECRTAIFDKTGTLTYGEPKLTETVPSNGWDEKTALAFAAELERYSKHPLARAIVAAAETAGARTGEAAEVSEPPGHGLRGRVGGHEVLLTSRRQLLALGACAAPELPAVAPGLECALAIDGKLAALFRFHDAPRPDSRSFIRHLGPAHRFARTMIVSGDREAEVRFLAGEVGISEVHAQKSPEEKLALVRQETARGKTLYVGDGINDAPAMLAATVGIAMGQNSDVTAEAADVVVMESTLTKLDEFIHISRRMLAIALQSAVGGMLLSLGGMALAASGRLAPVAGALAQEVIDVVVVLNALRAAFPPRILRR
jgi:heavy metal translocating P-type ATPase